MLIGDRPCPVWGPGGEYTEGQWKCCDPGTVPTSATEEADAAVNLDDRMCTFLSCKKRMHITQDFPIGARWWNDRLI